MVALPPWLQRWNFIERARLERQLWEAFERGDDLDALVEACRQEVAGGASENSLQLEIWEATLVRIRRIDQMMRDQKPSPPPQGDGSGE
jgi:hypothetical protein